MKMAIIGGGYAGCCVARMLHDRGHEVTIYERSANLGGMGRSFDHEGLLYEYGPHIIANHWCTERSIEFIKRITTLHDIELQCATVIRNGDQEIMVGYPPHVDDIAKLSSIGITGVEEELSRLPLEPRTDSFENYLIDTVGPTIYRFFYKEFTEKFWGIPASQLGSEWCKIRKMGLKTGSRRFFSGGWCTYPTGGWNQIFSNLTEGLDVRLNTEVTDIKPHEGTFRVSGELFSVDLLISTCPLDRMFGNRFGDLEFTGYELEVEVHDTQQIPDLDGAPISWCYYPSKDCRFSRITEYKKMNHQDDPRWILTKEIPSRKVKFYPFQDSVNENKFGRYLSLASECASFLSLGRLGLYKYLTVDSTTEQCFRFMDVFDDFMKARGPERMALYEHIRGKRQIG